MPGLDNDDWDDDFRPTPHPDDRLWRHPAEIAAEARAQAMAAAETLEVPTLLPPAPPQTQPRFRAVAVAAVSVLIVGSTALAAGTLAGPSSPSDSALAPASLSSAVSPGAPPAMSPSAVGPAASPAQAGIGVQRIAAHVSDDQSLATQLHTRLAGSLPRVQVVTEAGMTEGSGFFLTASGHIATSARLLHDAEYVVVWTEGNRRFQAEVVGSDMFSDVALLKIEPATWQPAAMDDQTTLRQGQVSYTLDHDLGAMTPAEISSPFGTLRDMGQPSAPRVLISQAASAGTAVIDEAGSIVAMSNGLTDGPSGHSIATPAWLVHRVALDMLVSGNSSHAWLGAELVETNGRQSVTISEIAPGSPAQQYGLLVNDELERIDGARLDSLETAMRKLYANNPGDEIDIMVVREDSRRVVTVTLGSLFDEQR